MNLYRGIIEDNNHPDKNGQCRVRIYGVHPAENGSSGEYFNAVKTSDLPWAEVMGSTEHGLVSGIGTTSVPKKGTMVWVIFDHNNHNKPIILGTATGVNTVDPASTKLGFSDPDGKYPLSDRLNEPDTNRLVRGDKLDQGVQGAIYTNKTNITAKDNDGGNVASFEEPETLSKNSVYPNNKVIETASGHIVELDDTSGNERVRVVHKSGSYVEIRPDGSIIQKSVGSNNITISTGGLQELIQGEVQKYIQGNLTEIVDGIVTKHYNSSVTENISSNKTVDIGGNLGVTASQINLNGSINMNGEIHLTGDVYINNVLQVGD